MQKLLIFLTLLLAVAGPCFGQQSDAALRRVRELDTISRDPSGKLQTQTAAEHLSRAETYSSNRLFPEAREHWSKVFDNFRDDAGVPKALFGMARSFMWERKYDKAVEWFEKLTKDHLDTKDGREGLAFKGASYVRMGKNLEAAKTYEQYVTMFPQGERIESAHLNIIDAYREAGKYDEANRWVDRTVQSFAGKPSVVNALHARLRMEIFRENWAAAAASADQLLDGRSFAGSMAGADEVRYLRAFALDRLQKASNSTADPYAAVGNPSSYYGALAADKVKAGLVKTTASASPTDYPVMYRNELLRYARANKVDPRFLLAIMKQESSFKPNAKSPAGARGLLQLVFDTADQIQPDRPVIRISSPTIFTSLPSASLSARSTLPN